MPLYSPAPGHLITQPFNGHNINEEKGYLDSESHRGRRSLFSGGTYNAHDHLAIDYAMPIGSKVVAPQDSVIVAQGTILRFADGTYDGEHYLIGLIRRTSTYQTAYLLTHLSEWLYSVGKHVKAESPIALSGASGKVTGPHTHFEFAVFPAGVSVAQSFWNHLYYRYNPLLFYAGKEYANHQYVQPNVY